MTSLEERINKIIVTHLGVKKSEVTPDVSFIMDLGADSLETIELVMAFEEEFDIEISIKDAEKMITVGDVIRHLDNSSKEE